MFTCSSFAIMLYRAYTAGSCQVCGLRIYSHQYEIPTFQTNLQKLNKLNQLDVTLWKFFIVQHVSNVITFILRSRRLCVGVLFCNDNCLCISVLFVGACLFVGSLVRGVLL